jgi:hypothetical protein
MNMFKYSLEVLKGRKREIEAHLADIYAKNGGILGVLEAQTQIHDLDDAIEMLEGINSELLKEDLLENVEGNAEKEGKLLVEDSKLSFESEEEAFQ